MAISRRAGSPFWWYDFTVNGQRFRGSTGTVDRASAKKVEAKLRNDAVMGVFFPSKTSTSLTISQILGKYYDEHIKHLPLAYNYSKVLGVLNKHLGPCESSKLKNADVAGFVAALRGTVTGATVNRYCQLLRAALNRARDAWDVDVGEPIKWKVHKQHEADRRERYLRPEEAERLIACASPHFRPVIRFALQTGLRAENIFGLTWDEVHLSERELRLKVKSRKEGGKNLVVPLIDGAMRLLEERAAATGGIGHVFRTIDGEPYSKQGYRRAFKTALKRAGIVDFRFHDLRHTAASWMAKGSPLPLVQKLLGHEDINTTMRYANFGHDELRAAMLRVLDKETTNVEVPATPVAANDDSSRLDVRAGSGEDMRHPANPAHTADRLQGDAADLRMRA
jgi:integrase